LLAGARLFWRGFTLANKLVLAVCALVIVISVVVLIRNRPGPLPPLFQDVPAANGAGGADSIKVDVAGAVVHPGVVLVAPDARVNDAVMAAGGATVAGDPNAINLAAHLQDGQKIVVPLRKLHN